MTNVLNGINFDQIHTSMLEEKKKKKKHNILMMSLAYMYRLVRYRHRVFYGVESWIGVLDWSHEWNTGVDSWSGTLECNVEA